MLKKLLATAVASLVLAAQATPLKTAQGDVEIAKVPERIAVYDIGALDTLVALGLGDKIVGIPGEKFAADFATPNAKEVGTLFEPDLEALNAAKPDLIIVASRSAGKQDEVKAVAQAVDLSVPGDNAYQEGLARLESLGAVFGKEAEAKKNRRRAERLARRSQSRICRQGQSAGGAGQWPENRALRPENRARAGCKKNWDCNWCITKK